MPLVNAASNFRFRLLEAYWSRTGADVLEKIYDDRFFAENNHLAASTGSADTLASEVLRVFRPRTVVDVGCGSGVYLAPLQRAGVEVLGLDASPASRRNAVIDPGLIRLHDVTRPLALGRRFDLAICIEVAEHIRTPASAQLVENLVRLSRTILFTAAARGQGGTHHINEQDRSFWIALFAEHGYGYDAALTRSLAAKLERAGCVFWIPRNLFVFRESPAADHPRR